MFKRNLVFILIFLILFNFIFILINFFFRLKVIIYVVKNLIGNIIDFNEKLLYIKDYMIWDDILKVFFDEDGNLSLNLINDKELEVKGCY